VPGDDEHRRAARRRVRAQVRHRAFELAAVGRRGLDRDAVDVGVFAGQLAERPPRALGVLRVGGDPFETAVGGRAEVDRGLAARRGRRPGRFEELLAGADEVGGAGADLLRVGEQHVGADRHRVGEQLQLAFAEHRDERFHAFDGDAVGQLGEHLGQVGVGFVRLRELRGLLPDRLGEQQLTARRSGDARDLAGQRPLVGDGERADLADLVTPELDPDRVLRGRAEQVEDAAADSELAALLDHVDAGVGQLDQPFQQGVEALLLADDQVDGRQGTQAGSHRLDQAPDGGDDDAQVVVAGLQPVEHFQPPPDGVGAGREPLVGQRLPGGEVGDPALAEERAQRRGQLVGLAAGGSHGEHGFPGTVVTGEGGDDELPRGDRPLEFEQRRTGALDHSAQGRVGKGGGEESGQ